MAECTCNATLSIGSAPPPATAWPASPSATTRCASERQTSTARVAQCCSQTSTSAAERVSRACLAYSPPAPSISEKYSASAGSETAHGPAPSPLPPLPPAPSPPLPLPPAPPSPPPRTRPDGPRCDRSVAAGRRGVPSSGSRVRGHTAAAEVATGSHAAACSSCLSLCGVHWHAAAKKWKSSAGAAPMATRREAWRGVHSYRPRIISVAPATSHRRVITRKLLPRVSTLPPIQSGRSAKRRTGEVGGSLRRSRRWATVRLVGRSSSSPTVPSDSQCSSTSTAALCSSGCSGKSAPGCARSTQPRSGTASSCTHQSSEAAGGGGGYISC